MSKDRKFPKCGNRKHPPITIQTQKEKYYEKIDIYSKKESDLRTPRDPIKETTQNSLKIFYSILFLCETRKRLQSGFRVFFFPLDLTKKEKHPPPKKKETKKKLFLSSFTIVSLCILFCSLSLSLSYMQNVQVSVTHSQNPWLYSEQIKQCRRQHCTKNSQIRKVERGRENDRKKEKKSGVCFLMLESREK